jgi:hypothetical protein
LLWREVHRGQSAGCQHHAAIEEEPHAAARRLDESAQLTKIMRELPIQAAHESLPEVI